MTSENDTSAADMKKKLLKNGKVMRVKVYLETLLGKFLPRRLLFIQHGVSEFFDRLIVQNETEREIKEQEAIRKRLRNR